MFILAGMAFPMAMPARLYVLMLLNTYLEWMADYNGLYLWASTVMHVTLVCTVSLPHQSLLCINVPSPQGLIVVYPGNGSGIHVASLSQFDMTSSGNHTTFTHRIRIVSRVVHLRWSNDLVYDVRRGGGLNAYGIVYGLMGVKWLWYSTRLNGGSNAYGIVQGLMGG